MALNSTTTMTADWGETLEMMLTEFAKHQLCSVYCVAKFPEGLVAPSARHRNPQGTLFTLICGLECGQSLAAFESPCRCHGGSAGQFCSCS